MNNKSILVVCVTALLGQVPLTRAASVAVTTYHNDNARTGVNSSEAILNTSNVNSSTFGKLYSLPVDGQIYAQPLYVPSVTIPGGAHPGVHNVLYVVTMHNTVYAFDADSATPEVLWSNNLGPSAPSCLQREGNCNQSNLQPEIGILSTPVIDLTTNSIYVVNETMVSPTLPQFALHSLNIATGGENAHSPVAVSGQVPGNGLGSVNGVLAFDPYWHWQRTGLTLLRGNIYFGFGSIGDVGPWHGWIFGYNGATLSQVVVKCTSPGFSGNAVWQGGAAFSADNSSNIYFTTGNGFFNASSGGTEWAEALIKMNTVTNTFTSYFVPSNESILDVSDSDISSVGTLILPASSPLVAPMIVSGGKDGRIFLLNTANLKGYNPVDLVVQEFESLTTLWPVTVSASFGNPVFYNGALYSWGSGDVLKRRTFSGSSFNATPASTGTYHSFNAFQSAPSLSISSNGTAAGTGIVWAVSPVTTGGNPATLRAYNAANLATELWDSDMRGSLDYTGNWAKWIPPTIANGKVYVPTLDGSVTVFGLLPR